MLQNPAQAKEKSPLGGEGGSCGEEDFLGRTGEDCTPGEDESVDGLAANGKPLLRYLNNAVLAGCSTATYKWDWIGYGKVYLGVFFFFNIMIITRLIIYSCQLSNKAWTSS